MNNPIKRNLFRRTRPRSNPYRSMVWIALILVGVMVIRGFQQGEIVSPFAPTPTPTRTTASFELEAETFFKLGKLNCAKDSEECAIAAYVKAARQDPNNAELWTQLARVQAYASNELTTNEERLQLRKQALASMDKAVKLAPDDSTVHATRAFVLDWLASSPLISKQESANRLAEAEIEATRALQLDATNTTALAYYAEILIDQQKWLQAEQAIKQAIQRDPNSFDVHRVNAYVLENMGDYETAIEEYKKAVEMAPNLTYLYINIGVILRHNAQVAQFVPDPEKANALYEEALSYFDQAATLNKQLGVRDPIPYLAIANTYSQMGEVLAAVLNVRSALDLNPSSAEVYAQLGLVYQKARNYEGAIPAFQCALRGCDAVLSCKVRQCDPEKDEMVTIQPIDLADNTLVYYYTYGSILAALSKPGNDYCAQAAEVFARIRNGFMKDDYVKGIVESGESICAAETQRGSATQTPVPTPRGLKPTATAYPTP